MERSAAGWSKREQHRDVEKENKAGAADALKQLIAAAGDRKDAVQKLDRAMKKDKLAVETLIAMCTDPRVDEDDYRSPALPTWSTAIADARKRIRGS